MTSKNESRHDAPARRYGTVATRDIEGFQGYRAKPCPSLMPSGDINISNHKFLDTEEAFEEFCRRIREAHEPRGRAKMALLKLFGMGCAA